MSYYKHISVAVQEYENAPEYLKEPAKIFCPKLDKLFKGLGWGRIFTIGGMSSSGKSTILEQIKNTFLEDPDIDILSFELEMLMRDQIERKLSSKYELEVIKASNVYYVDSRVTVPKLVEVVREFVYSIEKGRKVVVTIDHTLLVKGHDEKTTIDDLMQSLIELKIEFDSKSIPVSFIPLSQLNRDLERDSRILNPFLHYPTKNDLFAASSVFYCSDMVLIIHRPALINGIGEFYGPPVEGYPKGLPVKHGEHDMVYGHVIKNRFGKLGITSYYEDYEHSKICPTIPPKEQIKLKK